MQAGTERMKEIAELERCNMALVLQMGNTSVILHLPFGGPESLKD